MSHLHPRTNRLNSTAALLNHACKPRSSTANPNVSRSGVDCLPMKTFYKVAALVFVLGLLLLCFFAPWTTSPAGSSAPHISLGYAPVWSHQFATVSGSRVDPGAFAMLAGVVAFFAIVIGGAAYFFRNQRGSEREDV